MRYLLAGASCCLVLWPGASGHAGGVAITTGEKFRLAAVSAVGSSVYSQEDLFPLYKEWIGQDVDEARLRELAAAITRKYHRDGYLLARAEVPGQRVVYGVVRLRIVEGAITRADIEPAEPPRLTLIRRHLDRILGQRPLERKRLERYLGLIGDLHGAGGTFSLQSLDPDRRDYTLTVTLEDRDLLSIDADLDNRGSERIGPIRSRLGLRLHSAFRQYERIDLGVATASDRRELEYLDASIDWPVGIDGERLGLATFVRKSEPGGDLADARLEIDTTSVEVAVRRSLIRSFKQSLVARARIRHYDSRLDRRGARIRREKIGRVAADLVWHRFQRRGRTRLYGRVHQGIDSASAAPPTIRQDFLKLRIDLEQSLVLRPRTELVLRLKGQYAKHRLPSSERFAYGGAWFGRAFNPGELSGDRGIGATVEARSRLLTISRRRLHLWGYTFYDGARLWQVDSNGTDAISGTSAGIGARLNARRGSAFIEFAKPLTRPTREDGHDWRVFTGIALSF